VRDQFGLRRNSGIGVIRTTGAEDCPGNPCELVGQRHDDDVMVSAGQQTPQPSAEGVLLCESEGNAARAP
jgi:hypothetical protein